MAQLHPHFVYNTFNAIQNLILQKKNTLAHTYLGKLANFQRKTMQAFYKDKHSLMEELELAHLYIELENLRLSNRIEFTDSVFEQTGLLMHSVPTVLLRPFLERAIAFGLTPLQDRTPVLRLSIILLENRLKITIEDNGIGRALAKEIRDKKKKQHELLGLEASVDFEELKPSFGSSVNYHITDLFDENNRAVGTRVEIYVDLANKNEKSRSKNAVFS
jgi:LytS/YehU family sensor histidine kinase